LPDLPGWKFKINHKLNNGGTTNKMAEITSLPSQRTNRASPGELLKMLRNRSGLTQAQLAEMLGLKSARMVRNWEGEFNLPTADRLRHLIQLYLERQVFVAGKEREEVRVLWKVVKDWFETHNFNAETYPIFDEGWFNALLSQPQTSAPSDFTMFQAFRPGEGLTESAPYTLPEPIRLLGREQELARLSELLEQPGKKLLTMTGAGGSGKTSLALALGHALLGSFAGGVYLVELENVTSRESLVAEIARTLNLKEKPGQGLLQSLKDALRERHLLVILDNFEQLVAEAALVAELLKGSSRLNLVVTSRIPLQLSVEREYPVGPLSLPAKGVEGAGYEPGELVAAYPAIALFVERAHSVRPDFALSRENIPAVVEICRRLDGLPLALELAAARVRSFSPEKLLERLSLKMLTGGAKDLPARQQTLRATIEWSYSLLTSGEQRLFVRLAVFAGGCTLEAAEAVCNSEGDLDIEVFEGIDSLLTRNLLKQWEGEDGQTRYGMLVTIREFGLDKLAENGEKPLLLENYGAYFLTLANKLEPKLLVGEAVAAGQVINSDYDNFRTVLEQAIETENSAAALQISVPLGLYLSWEGNFNEGRSYLEKALALPFSISSSKFRAKALIRFGLLCNELGDGRKGRRCLEESATLYRELGDKSGIANALSRLAFFIIFEGEYTTAHRYLEECLAISHELNEKWLLGYTLNGLGIAALTQNEFEKARYYFEENQVYYREVGAEWGIAGSKINLGNVAVMQGKYEEARRYYEEGVALYREMGLMASLSTSLNFLSFAAINQGKYSEARVIIEETLVISRNQNSKLETLITLSNLGIIAFLEGNYGEARLQFEQNLAFYRKTGDKFRFTIQLVAVALVALRQGKYAKACDLLKENLAISQGLRDRFGLAHCLTGWAGLAVETWLQSEQSPGLTTLNYLTRAARLSGACASLLNSVGGVLWQPERAFHEQTLKLIQSNLGEAAFEEAFAEGAAMSMDEAVAYALAG
jgi:predicted ATPase/transcriptional regulator with XRE-family HTH domain/Tfp pilus assembly protein PilF